jgi:hypothetical protein
VAESVALYPTDRRALPVQCPAAINDAGSPLVALRRD